jgi:hypothetical protein
MFLDISEDSPLQKYLFFLYGSTLLMLCLGFIFYSVENLTLYSLFPTVYYLIFRVISITGAFFLIFIFIYNIFIICKFK